MINNQAEYEVAMLAVKPLVGFDPKRGTYLALILESLAYNISAYEDTAVLRAIHTASIEQILKALWRMKHETS